MNDDAPKFCTNGNMFGAFDDASLDFRLHIFVQAHMQGYDLNSTILITFDSFFSPIALSRGVENRNNRIENIC